MNIRSAEFAHDLKMPLQLICSCVQLLEMEVPRESHAADYLKMLMQSTSQLRSMILNALEEERAEREYAPVRTAPCDVISHIRDICRRTELLAQERNVHIRFSSNAAGFAMQTDSEKIERIVQNLLSNALKFSNENGEIKAAVNVLGDAVEISVADQGRGIPADMRSAVFERGVTDGGCGYGLAIVRSYAHLLGGNVSLRSEPGEGSVFTVRIPVCVKPVRAS